MTATHSTRNMSSVTSWKVELSVSPISCLHDEPISIKVGGLSPIQEVTLQATMKDDRGVHFISHAHYRADDNGQVDVEKSESLGGLYEGIFPMGLIGSLKPAPSEYKYTRAVKTDVTKPTIVTLSVHDGFLDTEALCLQEKEEHLATITHERHYMAPGVQRIPVHHKTVRGTLFLPPGDGPFPGVVDLFKTSGGILEYRSAQLASRGFASLTLALFNYKDLPKTLQEFNMLCFEEAVEYLLQHEKVLHNGVGVVGSSKGGDLALSMAAFIPQVRACININGACIPLRVPLRVKDHKYPALIKFSTEKVKLSDDGVMSLKHSIIDRKALDKHILPIEQSQAAFLFLVGSDDLHINSDYQAQVACQYLSKHNYKGEYEVVSYPGTGHLLEPPYSPHSAVTMYQSFGIPSTWGGTAKYHTLGQEKAWRKLRQFLMYHLVDKMYIQKSYNQQSFIKKSQL